MDGDGVVIAVIAMTMGGGVMRAMVDDIEVGDGRGRAD